MAKTRVLPALVVAVLALAGCSSSPGPVVTPPPAPVPGGTTQATAPAPAARGPLAADDEKLGGTYLGEAAYQVKADLGDPSNRRFAASIGVEYWDYQSGLTIYLTSQQQNVFGVLAKKNWSGQTPRGLKLGDSEQRLRELYGEPNYHGNNLWIQSKHAYVNDQTHLAISFDVNGGKVTGIQVLRLPAAPSGQ